MIRNHTRRTLGTLTRWVGGLALAALLACCSRHTTDELAGARAALQRNPSLDIVAENAKAGTFTVRIRGTGEMRTVRADELVAALPGSTAPTALTPAAPPGAAGGPAPASAPALASAAAGPPGAPAAAAGSPSPSDEAQPPAGASPPTAPPPRRVHVEAPPGSRLIASGPGYSISATGAPVLPASAADGSRGTAVGDAGARALTLPVEHRHEPIVCQGERMLHIDNRNLEFDGNALSAQDGCQLFITNSRIAAANGVGISARSAMVLIANSTIEGGASAVDGSGDAQIFAHGSQFKGVIRRLDSAAFHDQGGNVGD